MPAEWEPHAATWLTWPNSKDWPGKRAAVRWVYCDLIKKLSEFERVRLIVASGSAKAAVKEQLRRADVDVSRVDFFVAPTDRSWARDNLPLFVTSQQHPGVLGAVKWRFNGWARYPDHKLDEKAGRLVAKHQAHVTWEPLAWKLDAPGSAFPRQKNQKTKKPAHRRVVLEGGSIDVDGQGTLLTTRRCLLGEPHVRNPGLSAEKLELLLLAYLCAKRVLWLDDGIAGDDTQGHVDDFARFIAPGKVVLAQETNPNDENYVPLQLAREQLEGVHDAQGNRIEVIALPVPAPVVFDKERLPASYANFYIANEQVLVPTFNDTRDREALGILAELFPGRRVVGVHALDLVVGLGTLHCSTQQEPQVCTERAL